MLQICQMDHSHPLMTPHQTRHPITTPLHFPLPIPTHIMTHPPTAHPAPQIHTLIPLHRVILIQAHIIVNMIQMVQTRPNLTAKREAGRIGERKKEEKGREVILILKILMAISWRIQMEEDESEEIGNTGIAAKGS